MPVCLAFHVLLICPNESDGAFHFSGVNGNLRLGIGGEEN